MRCGRTSRFKKERFFEEGDPPIAGFIAEVVKHGGRSFIGYHGLSKALDMRGYEGEGLVKGKMLSP